MKNKECHDKNFKEHQQCDDELPQTPSSRCWYSERLFNYCMVSNALGFSEMANSEDLSTVLLAIV